MSNLVEYFYCTSCGYEGFDVRVGFIRSTANCELYECPLCKKETSDVEVELMKNYE